MKKSKLQMHLILALAALLIISAGCKPKIEDPIEPISAATQSDAPAPTIDTTPAGDDDKFSFSENIDVNGFWIGLRALDYIEPFGYRGMEIPSQVHQVTDAEIEYEINALLSEIAADKQITDRAVVNGDTVNIDYVGSVDGVEFSGGSTGGMGTKVTIGVTSYIDNFLEQLIGRMPGETFDVNVTFPDSYPNNPDLEKKAAVFVTTVNYIVGEADVELTDDFVAENFSASYRWTTVEQMKREMREGIQKEALEKHVQEYFTTQVTILSVPSMLLEYQERAMFDYFKGGAEYYGVELEEYLGYEGYSSVEELIDVNEEYNRTSAIYYLVCQAVAEDAGLSVSEEDLSAYFLKYAGTEDYSAREEYYGLPYLKQVVLYQAVLDYVIANAVLLP